MTAGVPSASMQATATNPRYAWMLVGFLWMAFLLNYVDRQLVFSIFPVLRKDLGFSDAQLGLIGSLFIWTYCLCMGPAGRLADLVRRDRLILGGLALWSLATLGTGLSPSVSGVLLWRVVMGVTESLYFPAALGLIAVLHSPGMRSRALAVHGTAQLLGIVAGGWYGGWMGDRFGWRAGFLILAAGGVAYAFVLAAVFRGLPKFKPEPRTAAAGSLREIFRSRCYITLILAFLTFGVMLWMLYAWLPDFIYEHYQLNLAESGLTATLYLQSSSAVGILGAGAVADWLVRRVRAGRFYIVGTGLVGAAPLAYLTLAVHSLPLLKVCAAGFGCFAGFLIMNAFAAAYDVVPRRDYGLATGVLNSLPGIASGTAIFLAGALKQSVGITRMMGWGAAGGLVMAVVLLATTVARFEREHRRAESES